MLLSATLIGLAFSQPMRIQVVSSPEIHPASVHTQTEYLSDWLQGHPGLMLLLGLLLITAAILPLMMACSPGWITQSGQNYLYLQSLTAGLATMGIVWFTHFEMAHGPVLYLSGYRALLMLGLWSSLGSFLWASDRLDRWML
jgi:hypothetical protein